MTRGRTPRPHSLQLLTGRSPGRDSGGRPLKTAPPFTRLTPIAPSWLSAAAQDEWARVVPEMDRLGMLKQLDGAALAAYCESWSLFVRASIAVRDEGATVEQRFANGSTRTVPHPAVSILLKASAQLRSWCAEFGLTPSAEMRLAKPRPSDADSDADWLLD